MDFYPTVLDLLAVETAAEAGPIDGISLLPLIDRKMDRRPKPIPLVSGGQLRLVDNDYILQTGRLFRFDESEKKDVDITDQKPEVFRRLAEWESRWRMSVREDQKAYKLGSPD